MNRKETGTYHIAVAGGENVKAFIPAPLPPLPSLEMDAVHAADKIQEIYQDDRRRLVEGGKTTKAVMQVHECMLTRQAANPKRIVEVTGLSLPSVMSALRTLESFGIVEEATGRQRNTRYKYSRTCDVLSNEVGNFS